MSVIYFISGHLDLTDNEFNEYYKPKIDEAYNQGNTFIVGDAAGADTMAQGYLKIIGASVIVYHMFEKPRNNLGFPTKGGFASDKDRDSNMTKDSSADIAWVRPGREKSGTAKNIKRRKA